MPITTGLTDNVWEELLFAIIKDCFGQKEQFIKWLVEGKTRLRYVNKKKLRSAVKTHTRRFEYDFDCSTCLIAEWGYDTHCQYVEKIIKDECIKSVKGSTRLSCYAESIRQGA